MAEEERKDKLPVQNSKSEAESLTIHGISRISSSQSMFSKFIWIFLCITASTFLIYFTVMSVKRHLKREVYMNAERKQRDYVSLPAITFCNSLDAEVYPKANHSYLEKQELPKNCSYTDGQYFKKEIHRQYFMQACRWFFGNHSFGILESIARVGRYRVEHIKFPKHFSFLPNFWPCFTLNPNQTLRQYEAGERAGLRMILYVDKHNDSKSKVLDTLDDYDSVLMLTIHDGRVHMNGFSTITLPVGFHTSIEISKHVIKRKPSPFPSNCSQAGDGSRNIFPGKENIETCRLSCFFKMVHKRCGGIYPPWRLFMKPEEYPGDINISDGRSLQCLYDTINHVSECDCRIPCEEEKYETKVSRVPWPPKWTEDRIYRLLFKNESGNKNSVKNMRNNLLKVSIYYTDISEVSYTEEEKYDIISILSDLGGQSGLFMGASVLSFIEILFLLTSCIISYFSKIKLVHALTLSC